MTSLLQVIVKKDGKIFIFCKGADNVIFERLDAKCAEMQELTNSHLNVSYHITFTVLVLLLCYFNNYNDFVLFQTLIFLNDSGI